jgi:hypothetical protein
MSSVLVSPEASVGAACCASKLGAAAEPAFVASSATVSTGVLLKLRPLLGVALNIVPVLAGVVLAAGVVAGVAADLANGSAAAAVVVGVGVDSVGAASAALANRTGSSSVLAVVTGGVGCVGIEAYRSPTLLATGDDFAVVVLGESSPTVADSRTRGVSLCMRSSSLLEGFVAMCSATAGGAS